MELPFGAHHLSKEHPVVLAFGPEILVVYLAAADKYARPLASRLSDDNQPVIMTLNRFSTPRPCLFADA
jgi:hypothetical protein